jgi:hypothetical protein
MKKCNRCGEYKPEFRFYKSSKSSDGRMGECKDCKDAYNRGWRAKQPKRPIGRPVTLFAILDGDGHVVSIHQTYDEALKARAFPEMRISLTNPPELRLYYMDEPLVYEFLQTYMNGAWR